MKEPATLMHSIRQRLLAHFEKSALFANNDPAMEAAPADSGQLLYAPVSGRIRALTRRCWARAALLSPAAARW